MNPMDLVVVVALGSALYAVIVALALMLFALAEQGDQALLQSAQACSAALLDRVPDLTAWAGAEIPALLREKLPYAIDALLRCLLGLLLLLLLPLISHALFL